MNAKVEREQLYGCCTCTWQQKQEEENMKGSQFGHILEVPIKFYWELNKEKEVIELISKE